MTRKQTTARKRPSKPKQSKKELSDFAHDYSKDYTDPRWPFAHGKVDNASLAVFIAVPIIALWGVYHFYNAELLKNSVTVQFDGPKIISEQATAPELSPDRYWGTYRPGVYFGLKTRSPKSPVVGLMWMNQLSVNRRPSLRHWCDQGDQLPMYGWFSHDGVNYGVQQIVDDGFILTTDFVKRAGGLHGGDWTARINVKPSVEAESRVVSLMFYMALDEDHGTLRAELQSSNKLTAIKGYTPELGTFTMSFMPGKNSGLKHNYLISHTSNLEAITEVTKNGFRNGVWHKSPRVSYIALAGELLPPDVPEEKANLIVYQVTVQVPFELEIIFESDSAVDRTNRLSGQIYQMYLQNYMKQFDERFEETFGLQAKGFKIDEGYFAKAALSNMLGSIGYFYGYSVVASRYTDQGPLAYFNASLLTAVPSRSFFPRGFLWDEGFHNMLISKWDMEISKDIIGHWLDLMNNDGWIPREQILGSEALARVPSQFVVQHNENANPPTLFLPLQAVVQQSVVSKSPVDLEYLHRLFPRLQKWYQWFNVTQQGPMPGTYRWRGRNPHAKSELNPKTLTSGLDDSPRASHPTPDEYHVDLRCWMALASSVMADIATAIGEPAELYQATYEALTDNKRLNELHWSSKHQYSDYGLHTDKVKLKTPPRPPHAQPGQNIKQDKERVTLKEPVYQHVNSLGYISLFPFLLKIVDPQSPRLDKILASLHNPQQLWTKYGIRSLSKDAPLYNKHNTEHDPPYWRGAIWINMNYLACGALHHYANTDSPYAQRAATVYAELRNNLVTNMMKEYRRTGYIWETYNDVTGHGQGSHPFTGWSALIVAIMAEEY